MGFLAQFYRCVYRAFSQLLELLSRFRNCRPAGLFEFKRGLSQLLDGCRSDVAGGGHSRQRFSSSAASDAADVAHGGCHGVEFVGGDAADVAGQNKILFELVHFRRAGVSGITDAADGSYRQIQRRQQPYNVAAKGFGRSAGTAEHVFELAALLQEYGQRGLAASNAGGDVSELRRDAAQCCGSLSSRYANLAQRCTGRVRRFLRAQFQFTQLG